MAPQGRCPLRRQPMSGSVREWLDLMKPGWSARFAAAFEELGIDDVIDLPEIDASVKLLLEEELTSAGAKVLHVKKIMRMVDLHAGPVSAARAKLAAAQAVDAQLSQAVALPVVAAVKALRAASPMRYAEEKRRVEPPPHRCCVVCVCVWCYMVCVVCARDRGIVPSLVAGLQGVFSTWWEVVRRAHFVAPSSPPAPPVSGA